MREIFTGRIGIIEGFSPMADLVKRLRDIPALTISSDPDVEAVVDRDIIEAADEIERTRARLAEAEELLRDVLIGADPMDGAWGTLDAIEVFLANGYSDD